MDYVPPGHALQQLNSTTQHTTAFKMGFTPHTPFLTLAWPCLCDGQGVQQCWQCYMWTQSGIQLKWSEHFGGQTEHLQALLDDIKGRHAGVADYGSGRARQCRACKAVLRAAAEPPLGRLVHRKVHRMRRPVQATAATSAPAQHSPCWHPQSAPDAMASGDTATSARARHIPYCRFRELHAHVQGAFAAAILEEMGQHCCW